MKKLLIVLLGLFWTSSAFGWAGGPPDGHAGAPPDEPNCTACHSTFPVNSGSGGVTVSGVTGAWEPLTEYDLLITVDDPDASRWGFEFTVLDQSGNSTGSLEILDVLTQISTTDNRTYAKQTTAGTQNGLANSASWTVRWTAPAADTGDISIYVAGNGANGNFGNSGDRIYTASATWPEGPISAVGMPEPSVLVLNPAFPNPFNPRTSITYELGRDMRVRLGIYALDGSLVRQLLDRSEVAGTHSVIWDGTNDRGLGVPSGVYLYRITADGGVMTRRMTLVR